MKLLGVVICGPHVLYWASIISLNQSLFLLQFLLTIKNGVPAGITAPLYVISLMLCRLNDRLSVDQNRSTSYNFVRHYAGNRFETRNFIHLDK